MENKLKIGIIGLGTVGQGVVKVLSKYDDIEIVAAAVKNVSKKYPCNNSFINMLQQTKEDVI